MYLETEDLSLYYEVRGSGPPLILIHGVIVDADLYSEAASYLSSFFRVVSYDRRGNSRSRYKNEAAFGMDEQAGDILNLMQELGIESAYFVGQSAGAMIGQYFLQKYPEKVRHLIMYEPAIMGFLDDMPNVHEWTGKVKKLILKGKYNSALLEFAQKISQPDARRPKKSAEETVREFGNHEYALTCEFPELVSYHPDFERTGLYSDKISLAMGEKSTDPVYMDGMSRFAEALGTELLFYPGFHNLPYDLPKEFAISVLGTLLLEDPSLKDDMKDGKKP